MDDVRLDEASPVELQPQTEVAPVMALEAVPAELPIPAPAATVEPLAEPVAPRTSAWRRAGEEIVAAVQTLLSAAVYATLIVTFCVQVARVDGLSMAPTLEDQDRLIVNKLVYLFGDPQPGDIVMLYYPVDPDKMF